MFVEQILSGATSIIHIVLLGIIVSVIYLSIRMALPLWRGFQVLYAIRKQPMQPIEEESPPHHIQSEAFDEKMHKLGLTLIGRVRDTPTSTDQPTRCYVNDSGTVYALAEMGDQFPEAILFGTHFADDSTLITLSPNGTKLTTDKCAFAYALEWTKGYEYQLQQVRTWRLTHGSPILNHTVCECVENHFYWETHYRRSCMARFIRFSLISLSLTALIVVIAVGMGVATVAGVNYPYLIPVVVMVGMVLLIRTVNKSWINPTEAVDYHL